MIAKYAKKCTVFLKKLHSWQKFYTTASRGGRDKFQLLADPINIELSAGCHCVLVHDPHERLKPCNHRRPYCKWMKSAMSTELLQTCHNDETVSDIWCAYVWVATYWILVIIADVNHVAGGCLRGWGGANLSAPEASLWGAIGCKWSGASSSGTRGAVSKTNPGTSVYLRLSLSKHTWYISSTVTGHTLRKIVLNLIEYQRW